MKPRIQLLLREIKHLEEELELIERRKEELEIIERKIEETKVDFFSISDQVEKEYSDVIKIEKKFNRKYLRRNKDYLKEQFDKEKQEYFIIQSRFKALQNMLESYKYQAKVLKGKLSNSETISNTLIKLKIQLFNLVKDQDPMIKLRFKYIQEQLVVNKNKSKAILLQKDGIESLNKSYNSLCQLLATPSKWNVSDLMNTYGKVPYRRKHWSIAALDQIQRLKQEFNHLDILSHKLDSGLKFSYFQPRWNVISTIVSANYSNQNWFLRDLQSQIETIKECMKQHDFLLKTIEESLQQIVKTNKKLSDQRDAILNEQIEKYG